MLHAVSSLCLSIHAVFAKVNDSNPFVFHRADRQCLDTAAYLIYHDGLIIHKEVLMKILKWILIGLGIVVVILAVAFIFFRVRYNKMVEVIDSVELSSIDLAQIEDGVYRGEFGEFLVSVTLDVTVEEHTITGIEIIEQNSGPGYEAHEVIDRIIQAQSPDVDAVTGATGSSKCIMIAVQKALQTQ